MATPLNATGIISAISKYNSIMLDSYPDKWFSCYRKEQLDGVNKGDAVSINYTVKTKGTKEFFNVQGTVQVIDSDDISVIPKLDPGPTATRTFPPRVAEFPVPALDRTRPIIRQNALSHATQVVLHVRKDVEFAPMDLATQIVDLARYFESYSDGSLDAVGVEAEAEDLIAKMIKTKKEKKEAS